MEKQVLVVVFLRVDFILVDTTLHKQRYVEDLTLNMFLCSKIKLHVELFLHF